MWHSLALKAVLCKQFGPPESLVLEELPSPKPGPGEVVVSVKAASVNFPDVLIIQNKYQFKPPLPFSPGSELAGVVKEVGEGVKAFKPGDKVIAFTTYGAFAEEVKTDAARLLPLPPGMDFASGAAFLLTYATSDHALRDRAQLEAGETLLVLGAAGGVGLAAVEIAKAIGAKVIAVASSEAKRAICLQHGADAAIGYDSLREQIKTLTEGKGVDVVYDAVGGAQAEPAIRSYAQVMACDSQRFARFFHAMLEGGVYLAPSAFEAGFVSAAHGERELARTFAAAAKAFRALGGEAAVPT